MTVEEFADKFNRIKDMGFVPSKRRGPTGIGYTFETLLGIDENNRFSPDIEGVELKTHRFGGNGLITLFTFNRKAWKIPPLDAVKQYGSLDRNGRQGLYYTMSLKPNSAGLFLDVQKSTISVRHVSGTVIVEWSLETLANRFIQKIPALMFVTAFTEVRDDIEYFHFCKAQYMKGTNPDLLCNEFKAENILLDVRIQYKEVNTRNNDTGFIVYEKNIPELFTHRTCV